MTWRKSTQPNQPSTVEDSRVEAGKIDGLLEALVISADGTVCSNLIAGRKQTQNGPASGWRAQPPHSASLLPPSADTLFRLPLKARARISCCDRFRPTTCSI